MHQPDLDLRDALEAEFGGVLDALCDEPLWLLADAVLPGGRKGFAMQYFLRARARKQQDQTVRPALIRELARRAAAGEPLVDEPVAVDAVTADVGREREPGDDDEPF